MTTESAVYEVENEVERKEMFARDCSTVCITSVGRVKATSRQTPGGAFRVVTAHSFVSSAQAPSKRPCYARTRSSPTVVRVSLPGTLTYLTGKL